MLGDTSVTTLKMIFSLANGKQTTLNLVNPKANLTLAEANDVSEALLNHEAIIVGGSAINELKDVYKQTVTRTDLT